MEKALFQALTECRCPQCRKDKMFVYPAWNLLKATKMNEICSECGLKYEVEPGFFWGAMYISYAFSVAISVIVGMLDFWLLDDPELWVYIFTIIPASIVLAPLSMRYSRTIMLFAFGGVSYRGE